MTIRMLLAAALLVPAAAGAQGWGSQGHDPNDAKNWVSAGAATAPADAPAPAKSAPKIKAKRVAAHYDEDGGYDLDDSALDRGRLIVDRQLAARKAALAAQTQRLDGYHAAMEKDSVDAERQMAEERKAFLLYLKSVPQEDRAQAMKTFEERQADKRKELDKRHLAQYKAWFEENIKDNWRSQPLAAEDVSAPAEAAAPSPAAAEEVAQAAPAKHAAIHAKAKRRVVHHARTHAHARAQAQAAPSYQAPARMAAPAAAPAAAAMPTQAPPPAPIQAQTPGQ